MTKYGFFECRAELQKSPGVWAAFWIQSTEISKGRTRRSTERKSTLWSASGNGA